MYMLHDLSLDFKIYFDLKVMFELGLNWNLIIKILCEISKNNKMNVLIFKIKILKSLILTHFSLKDIE